MIHLVIKALGAIKTSKKMKIERQSKPLASVATRLGLLQSPFVPLASPKGSTSRGGSS